MTEKFLKSRIVHKHDTEADWSKSSLVPLQGEIVVFDADENCSYERFKIGDGETNVNELPFVGDEYKDKLDSVVQNVTVGTGLTATKTDDTVAIDIDDNVVLGFDCGTAEDLIEVPSVEELQEKYAFTYYSSMGKAVTDVNNGTLANSDATKDSAVAGVYTDENGGKNVVLLKDATEAERVKPTVDMTINLGGHTLSVSSGSSCFTISGGNIVIDGRLPGSCIAFNRDTTCTAFSITSSSAAESLTINGARIRVDCISGNSYAINASSAKTKVNIVNCDIEVIARNGVVHSLLMKGESEISGCKIVAISYNGSANGITNHSNSVVSSCDIRAYTNYGIDGVTYTEASQGVYNFETLIINNCYVMGTHSGVNNSGTLYVNGGTYEGYGHGGIYFATEGGTSYVRDATIRVCAMPDGYTDNGAGCNDSGFYIGSAANQHVYMDNCDIYGNRGTTQTISIAGTYGAHDNYL